MKRRDIFTVVFLFIIDQMSTIKICSFTFLLLQAMIKLSKKWLDMVENQWYKVFSLLRTRLIL